MQESDFYCQEVFSGKTKVEVVEEVPTVLAFRHTKPSYKFHVVIVPKDHVRQLIDLQDMATLKEIFEIAKKIIIRFGLHETNYRIITNGGSFQDSKHLHFHLISGEKIQ